MFRLKKDKPEGTPAAGVQVVTFGPSFDVLADLQLPLNPAQEKQAREAIRIAKERMKLTVRELKLAELKRAEAEHEIAEARRRQIEDQLREAQQNLRGLPDDHVVAGTAALACFSACVVAEFAFNQQALPWLLDISPRSVIGMLLSLAPATAPLVLELVLPRLFALEDLIGHASPAVSSAIATARRILGKLFWLAVMLTTLGSLYLVAECREIAAWLMTHREVTALGDGARRTQQLTVIALSLALAVNGALFYLFGMAEVRKAWRRWRAGRRTSRLDAEASEARATSARAASDLEVKRYLWNQVDAEAERAAEAYEARELLRLFEMAGRREKPASAWQQVQQMILEQYGVRPGWAALPAG